MPDLFATSTPCSIHVPLLKGETADADSSTWPPAVHALMARELDRFAQRNPDLDIGEQRTDYDAGRRVCVIKFVPTLATTAATASGAEVSA
jgi:hypothetical protein